MPMPCMCFSFCGQRS